MEYYQTQVLTPIENEWLSASEIIPVGDELQITASQKLTMQQAEAELIRLKKMYKNLEFRIWPANE